MTGLSAEQKEIFNSLRSEYLELTTRGKWKKDLSLDIASTHLAAGVMK